MIFNWIYGLTNTTGTGDLILQNVPGYASINSQVTPGQVVSYQVINNDNGSPIEQGIGRFTASGLIVRERVTCTYDGNTLNNASPDPMSLAAGLKQVVISPSANCIVPTVPNTCSPLKAIADANGSALNSTGTISSTLSYAIPFISTIDRPINAVLVRVTDLLGLSAGGTMLTEIRSFGINGEPGTVLSSGSASINATGMITIPLTDTIRPPCNFYVIIKCSADYQVIHNTAVYGTHCLGVTSSFLPIGHLIKTVGSHSLPTNWQTYEIPTGPGRPSVFVRYL